MTVRDMINKESSLPKAYKWQSAGSGQWYGIIEGDESGMKWLSEKLGDAEVSIISEEANHCGTNNVITFEIRR